MSVLLLIGGIREIFLTEADEAEVRSLVSYEEGLEAYLVGGIARSLALRSLRPTWKHRPLPAPRDVDFLLTPNCEETVAWCPTRLAFVPGGWESQEEDRRPNPYRDVVTQGPPDPEWRPDYDILRNTSLRKYFEGIDLDANMAAIRIGVGRPQLFVGSPFLKAVRRGYLGIWNGNVRLRSCLGEAERQSTLGHLSLRACINAGCFIDRFGRITLEARPLSLRARASTLQLANKVFAEGHWYGKYFERKVVDRRPIPIPF